MEEDFDQVVRKCVAMLMSDDPELVMQSAELLQELFRMDTKESTERLARIVQEIAAYRGGAVLSLIWKGTWGRCPGGMSRDTAFEYTSSFAPQLFSSSRRARQLWSAT